jgi:GntR family transcriptional regulator/MocR family aminotransferase
MSKTWAKIGGADLLLELSGTRVRAGLEAALRGAIRAERLRPGMRLPSSRALAADLGIARNTVAEVYSQLVAEGWLTAQAGAGTSVAPRLASGLGGAAAAASATEPGVPRYDLRAGVPDLSAFPRRAWLATARRVLAAAPDHLLGYPDPRGLPQLRVALADYLARARGVIADPGCIVICGGFSHGLAAVSRMLCSDGARTLAVEAYGHEAHRAIARGQGLRLRPVPVDDRGAVVGAAGDADAMLLTPAHQFPLGAALHPRRRHEVAGWGGLVIEDDYDGEFRYDRQPVGALQALAPGRVIYAGTASKSLAPGLRLGWLVVPPRLLDAVTAGLANGPSGLDQLTLAEFITSGAYDRQVRRARLGYRRRRDRLAAALSRGGWRPGGIAAGLQAVLEFPGAETERAVLARAAVHRLTLDGLGLYRAGHTDDGRAGLVIGFARPPEHAYTTALARLSAILPAGPRDLLPVSYPLPGREPGCPSGRTQECGPGARLSSTASLLDDMAAARRPGRQSRWIPGRLGQGQRRSEGAGDPHGAQPRRGGEQAGIPRPGRDRAGCCRDPGSAGRPGPGRHGRSGCRESGGRPGRRGSGPGGVVVRQLERPAESVAADPGRGRDRRRPGHRSPGQLA